MNVANYLRFVPDIEKSIVDNNLDSIVIGGGPTAWLVPWIDSKILSGVRLWGAHDVHKIIPVNDLVLMDSPSSTKRLLVGTASFEEVLNSRPGRIWINDWWWDEWMTHLHFSVHSICVKQRYFVWTRPRLEEGETAPKKFTLDWPLPNCGYVSPIACTTTAWMEGDRRIGVIGVDMGPDHHTKAFRKPVDSMFAMAAQQAHEAGGVIINLSPITSLRTFKSWIPSSSSSEPTSGSETPELKTS